MSNLFNITKLAGQKLLVTGDANQAVVLDTAEWDGVAAFIAEHDAQHTYDTKVEEFFAPLVAAADELEKITLGTALQDPAFVVTLHDEVEGVESKDAVQMHLSDEAAIVRLLLAGDFSRLIWVSNSEIAILALDTEVAADLAEFTSAVEQAVAVANDES